MRIIATQQPERLQMFVTKVCGWKHLGEGEIRAAFTALDALRIRMDKQVFQNWLRGLKAAHPALRGKIAALLQSEGR